MSTPEELAALALDGADAPARLASLEKKLAADRAAHFMPEQSGEVNNHIHTVYSFSPYTPAEAAYGAWRSGLEAAGIIDHESVSGCEEMLEAGKRIGMAVTSGCELRVDAAGTALEGRTINNPDSDGLLYMVIHGIPHHRRDEVDAFLASLRVSRNRRMAEQVGILNEILADAGVPTLGFETDVVPISKSREGGSITERHILYALAVKMSEAYGRGASLLNVLKTSLGLSLSDIMTKRLSDETNPHFLYDMLGLFKGSLVPRFFRQPDAAECPSVKEATALADRVGAIPCYPYLGDVGESPTGDKKAQKFEDDWLDLLFAELPKLGFRAVTYMPPRNTKEQLARVKSLCEKTGLMEISGVDINSSRQVFRCPEVTLPEFIHLNDRTWALIAHEHLASLGGPGLFDAESPLADAPLDIRLDIYARMGRKMDPSRPVSIKDAARLEGLWTD
ncbi:MAG: PHP domain-containing protein [Spirochaetaceae bacterium]|nr:PHP domain-containing protein [Spirochaetaceae bacterium]